jgi:hypothetical protein
MIIFEKFRFRFFYPEGKSGKKVTTQCLAEKSSKGIFSKEVKMKVVGIGTASCSINDNFCREKGRKLSLLRAMKQAGMDKNQRKLIWELYRVAKPGGRW